MVISVTWVNVPTYRIVIEGHLGGSEMFATSFWIQQATGSVSTDPNAVASDIVARLATNGTGATTIGSRLMAAASNGDGIDRVRAYRYVSGSNTALSAGVASSAAYVGPAVRALPNQCCLVATLQTANAGRSYRGRMYLPAGIATAGSGLMASATIDSVANGLGDLFGSIQNNAGAAQGHVVVWSPTKDATTFVKVVRVDNKLDTQRRRNAKVVASYSKSYAGLG